ncbi:MAG: hypothetical protein ACE14T_06705 [Syntrophales bacterium]
MDAIIQYLSAHPFVMIIAGIVLLVVFLYMLKSFFKFVVIGILILLLAMIGYHYFTAEGKFEERIRRALVKTKDQAGEVVEKGKGALAEHGKKLTKSLDREGTLKKKNGNIKDD